MWGPRRQLRLLARWLTLLACLLLSRAGFAHPELHDRIEIVTHGGGVDVSVTASMQTVIASIARRPRAGAFYEAAEIDVAIADHLPYLASHLRFEIDGKPVSPSVRSARREPPSGERLHRLADLERAHVRYELAFPSERPSRLRIAHAMLTDVDDEIAKRWNLTYVVEVKGAAEPAVHPLRAGETLDVSLAAPTRRSFIG